MMSHCAMHYCHRAPSWLPRDRTSTLKRACLSSTALWVELSLDTDPPGWFDCLSSVATVHYTVPPSSSWLLLSLVFSLWTASVNQQDSTTARDSYIPCLLDHTHLRRCTTVTERLGSLVIHWSVSFLPHFPDIVQLLSPFGRLASPALHLSFRGCWLGVTALVANFDMAPLGYPLYSMFLNCCLLQYW